MQNYRLKKGNIIQKIDNKTTIFDGDRSCLYTLNETASYIFNQLKRGFGDKDIVKALIKKYKISQIMAEKDVKEIISDLLKKKIVSKTKQSSSLKPNK